MELQRLFGANVRHHRKARGWTLEQLAGQVGISRESIGKIERGKAAPLFETAEKIATALEVPVSSLFSAAPPSGTGERARLITDIHATLSRMNEQQLGRIAKMLKAYMG